MRGLIVNLFKRPLAIGINPDEETHNIMWMHYDYYSLKKVEKFEEYFCDNSVNIEAMQVQPEGESQSIYLYSADLISRKYVKEGIEKEFIVCENSTTEAIKVKQKDGSETIPDLLCLITIKLRTMSKDEIYDQHLIKNIKFFEAALKSSVMYC